jgi:hypothetical protein
MVSFRFFVENSYGRSMTQGWTQPLTNEYQEYFLGGKGDRCVGLPNLPPSCASGSLSPQNPQGLRTVQGLLWLLDRMPFVLSSSAEVNDEWSCNFDPPYGCMACTGTTLI